MLIRRRAGLKWDKVGIVEGAKYLLDRELSAAVKGLCCIIYGAKPSVALRDSS